MKTDYKVGDWCILDNSGSKYIGQYSHKNGSIILCDLWKSLRNINGAFSTSRGGFYSIDRLATPEEIIKAGGIPNNLITFNYLIL